MQRPHTYLAGSAISPPPIVIAKPVSIFDNLTTIRDNFFLSIWFSEIQNSRTIPKLQPSNLNFNHQQFEECHG